MNLYCNRTTRLPYFAWYLLIWPILLLPSNVSAGLVQWKISDGGNGHFYDVLNDRTEVWSGMQAFAQSLTFGGAQGHLATVTTIEEHQFLIDTFGAPGLSSAAIGLTDEDQEGVFTWVTGEELTFTNWGVGEPNNAGGIEDYGFYASGSTGKWNDFVDTVSTTRMVIEFSPVPEPSAAAMTLIGLGIVSLRRRKSRHS